MKQTEMLILGASAYGLAAACRWGDACLVCEAGISAGAEFSDAMMASPVSMEKTGLPLTDSILDELRERNAVDAEGNLHILAVGPILTDRYVRSGCRILSGTEVLSVTEGDAGTRVTLFHPQTGFREILARQVLDTRVRTGMPCVKSLGLLLCGDETLPLFDDGRFWLQRGAFADERVLRVRLKPEDDMPAAQELFDRFLREHPERIGSARAAGLALRFGYTFSAPVGSVSASYGDVLSAVREGERRWN